MCPTLRHHPVFKTIAIAMDARPAVTQMPGVSSRGWTYLGVNILFLILVTVVVAARFWSRRLTKARYGWDDWLILGALVVYCGQFSFNVWVIRNGGLGHHVKELPNIAVENTLLQLTISQFIYAINFILIRFSICMLLMRIFPQRWLRHSSMFLSSGLNWDDSLLANFQQCISAWPLPLPGPSL
jgi:hypothetical protein